jgi:hypothetical protein
LVSADPDCQWAEHTWTYREEHATGIQIINVKEIHAEITSTSTFIVYVQPAIAERYAGVSFYATGTEAISLPMKYEDHANVFLKKKAASLLNHARVKHTIIIRESEEVLYRFIYPLFKGELQVLSKYLETNMAKG